jgi:hypothetical protein
MPDRERLSRELRDEELPEQATEELEEARTVRRRPPLAGRAGGSEERPGVDRTPREMPREEERLPIEPPPRGVERR